MYRLDTIVKQKKEYLNFLKIKKEAKHELEVICPSCKKRINEIPKKAISLLATDLGLIKEQKKIVYLRPETCQGIFASFPNIKNSIFARLPFGVGQVGKSFRKEITPQRGVFRTFEFEQMELEFFCSAAEKEK